MGVRGCQKLAATLLVIVAAGCGGSGVVAGPSVPATMPTPAAPTTPRWPASLDPAYVAALVYDPPRRWPARASLAHCFEGAWTADARAHAESAAAGMNAITGAPAGRPCNVRWILDPSIGDSTFTFYASTSHRLAEDGTTILEAHLRFRDSRSVVAGAVHESGHALGLRHSPRPSDAMWPSSIVDSFSSDELLVLDVLYPAGR